MMILLTILAQAAPAGGMSLPAIGGLIVGVLGVVAALITAIVGARRSGPERVNLQVTGMQSVVVSQSSFLDQVKADNAELRQRMDSIEEQIETLEAENRKLLQERDAAELRARAAERKAEELERRMRRLEDELSLTKNAAGLAAIEGAAVLGRRADVARNDANEAADSLERRD